MKKILFYSILISLIVSCQSREIQIVEEIYQDGSSKKIVDYLVQGSDTLVLHELSFHKDGSKLMEGYFENNQREGEWLSWFPDGSIWSKGYFSKGKRTGKSWIYHRNGQLYMKGAYLNGEKTGMWIVFNEEGIVLTTTTF